MEPQTPSDSAPRTSDGVLRELLKGNPDLSVLLLSLFMPKSIYEHPGPVVYIGNASVDRAFKSTSLRFLLAANTSAIHQAVDIIRRERPGFTFDVVIIDHEHQLASVIEHIRAALIVSSSETLFLFDDAVPPTIGMAGPKPTQAWWVGEVWMLSHLLKRADSCFFALTCKSEPTGLLAAAGFALPAPHEIITRYADLSKVATDAELAALSNHTSVVEFLAHCQKMLERRTMHLFMELEMGLQNDPALSSRTINESRDWIKPAPQFVLDLSGRSLDASRLYHADRRAHSKTIDTFYQGHLVGSESVVKDGKYFDHKSNLPNDDRLDRLAKGHGTYSNFGTGIRFHANKIVLPLERLENAEPINEPVMLGTPDELDNWGMWLLFGVPSLWEFIHNRNEYSKFMAYVRHPWQRALLLLLGLSPSDLLEHNHETCYRFSRLSMVRHSYRDLVITPDDKVIFGNIAQHLTRAGSSTGSERIFISRLSRTRKSEAYRGLTNEQALINGLTKIGFTIVEPETLDFQSQVAVFNSARFVVGLGGAAMFNAVFCRPQTKVVTIESGTTFIDGHTNIFASMEFEYGVIFGEEDLTDPRLVQRRWTLDVDSAIAQIVQFGG
jgi:hypothetical protein